MPEKERSIRTAACLCMGNTLQYASTGRRIGNPDQAEATQVMIGPMGRFDNFVVKQQ